jgi:hypothetical protein
LRQQESRPTKRWGRSEGKEMRWER